MRDSVEHGSAIDGTASSVRIAYRVRDAADQIGVSEREMWRLLRAGEIESFKYGQHRTSPRRISYEALVAYVQRKQEETRVAELAA